MIGQNIGLTFLIPLAIEQLEENILAEGDFYEGDLLKVVLDSKEKYWKKEKQNWNKVCRLFEKNKSYINEFCLNNGYKNKWIIQYQSFVKFN